MSPENLDSCSTQHDQGIHISLVIRCFLKSQAEIPHRQVKDKAKWTADCCMSRSEQLQSRRQGLQCSLSRDRYPLSSTTTILVQAAITLSLDKHEMPLAVFPTSSSSFPIHCLQSVQSKHLKTENRPRLSPTSAPLTLCLSLVGGGWEQTLKPCSGPAHSSSLLRAHSPVTLTLHPHSTPTLLNAQTPQHLRDFARLVSSAWKQIHLSCTFPTKHKHG